MNKNKSTIHNIKDIIKPDKLQSNPKEQTLIKTKIPEISSKEFIKIGYVLLNGLDKDHDNDDLNRGCKKWINRSERFDIPTVKDIRKQIINRLQ